MLHILVMCYNCSVANLHLCDIPKELQNKSVMANSCSRKKVSQKTFLFVRLEIRDYRSAGKMLFTNWESNLTIELNSWKNGFCFSQNRSVFLVLLDWFSIVVISEQSSCHQTVKKSHRRHNPPSKPQRRKLPNNWPVLTAGRSTNTLRVMSACHFATKRLTQFRNPGVLMQWSR